jgi:hypothetical protein
MATPVGVLNGNSRIHEYVMSLQQAPDNKQNEQDRRIIRLKKLLRGIMGEEAFKAFYRQTSFNGDILEAQLNTQLHNLITRAVQDAGLDDRAGLIKILKAVKKGTEQE